MNLNRKIGLKKTTTFFIIFAMLTQNANCLAVVKWDMITLSKIIFGFFSILMILAFLLLFVGIFTNNKPFDFYASWRILVFGFAASATLLVGSDLNNGHRGLNTHFYLVWYNRMHDSLFGAKTEVEIFKSVKNVDTGSMFVGYVNFFNKVFFEVLMIVICRILGFGPKAMKNLSQVVTLGLGIKVWVAGFWWFKQEANISEANSNGEKWERPTFDNLMGWVFSILAMLIVLEQAVRLFFGSVNPEEDDLKEQEAERARRRDYRPANRKESGDISIGGSQHSKKLIF